MSANKDQGQENMPTSARLDALAQSIASRFLRMSRSTPNTLTLINRLTQVDSRSRVWQPNVAATPLAIARFTDAIVERFPTTIARKYTPAPSKEEKKSEHLLLSGEQLEVAEPSIEPVFDADQLPSIPDHVKDKHQEKRASLFGETEVEAEVPPLAPMVGFSSPSAGFDVNELPSIPEHIKAKHREGRSSLGIESPKPSSGDRRRTSSPPSAPTEQEKRPQKRRIITKREYVTPGEKVSSLPKLPSISPALPKSTQPPTSKIPSHKPDRESRQPTPTTPSQQFEPSLPEKVKDDQASSLPVEPEEVIEEPRWRTRPRPPRVEYITPGWTEKSNVSASLEAEEEAWMLEAEQELAQAEGEEHESEPDESEGEGGSNTLQAKRDLPRQEETLSSATDQEVMRRQESSPPLSEPSQHPKPAPPSLIPSRTAEPMLPASEESPLLAYEASPLETPLEPNAPLKEQEQVSRAQSLPSVKPTDAPQVLDNEVLDSQLATLRQEPAPASPLPSRTVELPVPYAPRATEASTERTPLSPDVPEKETTQVRRAQILPPLKPLGAPRALDNEDSGSQLPTSRPKPAEAFTFETPLVPDVPEKETTQVRRAQIQLPVKPSQAVEALDNEDSGSQQATSRPKPAPASQMPSRTVEPMLPAADKLSQSATEASTDRTPLVPDVPEKETTEVRIAQILPPLKPLGAPRALDNEDSGSQVVTLRQEPAPASHLPSQTVEPMLPAADKLSQSATEASTDRTPLVPDVPEKATTQVRRAQILPPLKPLDAPRALDNEDSGSQVATLRQEPVPASPQLSQTVEPMLPAADKSSLLAYEESTERTPLSPDVPEKESTQVRRAQILPPLKRLDAPGALDNEDSGSQVATLRQEPVPASPLPSQTVEPMLPVADKSSLLAYEASTERTPLSPDVPEKETTQVRRAQILPPLKPLGVPQALDNEDSGSQLPTSRPKPAEAFTFETSLVPDVPEKESTQVRRAQILPPLKPTDAPQALDKESSGSQLPTLRQEPVPPSVMPSRTVEPSAPYAPRAREAVPVSERALSPDVPEKESTQVRRAQILPPLKPTDAPQALDKESSGSQLPTLRQEPVPPSVMPSRTVEPSAPYAPRAREAVPVSERALSPDVPEKESTQVRRAQILPPLKRSLVPRALDNEDSGSQVATLRQEPASPSLMPSRTVEPVLPVADESYQSATEASTFETPGEPDVPQKESRLVRRAQILPPVKPTDAPQALDKEGLGSQVATLRQESVPASPLPTRTVEPPAPYAPRGREASTERTALSPDMPEKEKTQVRRAQILPPLKPTDALEALDNEGEGSQLATLRQEAAPPSVMPSRTVEPPAPQEPSLAYEASQKETPLVPDAPLQEAEPLAQPSRAISPQPAKTESAPLAFSDEVLGTKGTTIPEERLPSAEIMREGSPFDRARPEPRGIVTLPKAKASPLKPLSPHLVSPQVEKPSELKGAPPVVKARRSSAQPPKAKAPSLPPVVSEMPNLPRQKKAEKASLGSPVAKQVVARKENEPLPLGALPLGALPQAPQPIASQAASDDLSLLDRRETEAIAREASPAMPHVVKGQLPQFSPLMQATPLSPQQAEEQEVAAQAEPLTLNAAELALLPDEQPEEATDTIALPLTAHEADIEEQASPSQSLSPLIPFLAQGISEPSVESEPVPSLLPQEMESVAKDGLRAAEEADVSRVKPVVEPATQKATLPPFVQREPSPKEATLPPLEQSMRGSASQLPLTTTKASEARHQPVSKKKKRLNVRTSPLSRLSIRRTPKALPLKRVVVRRTVPFNKASTDKPASGENVPTPQIKPTQPPTVPPQMTFLRRSQRMLQAQGWRFKEKPSITVSDPSLVSRTVAQLTPQSSGGRKLDQKTRTTMEGALGRDFSDVRVHTVQLAPLNVQAASRGRDVYVEPGGDSFETPESMALLGHELTHVAHAGFAKSKSPIQRLTSSNDNMSISRSTSQPRGADSSPPLISTSLSQDIASEEASAEQSEQKVMRYLQEGSTREAMPLKNLRGTTRSSQPVMRAWAGREPDFTSGDSIGGTLAPLADTSTQTSVDVPATVTQASPLLQRMPLAASQPMIQRSEAAEAPASESNAEGKDDGKTSAQKLSKLARQIYPIIKRMLSVERERSFGR